MKLAETEKRRLIVHARVKMKAQKRRNMGVINTCRVCVCVELGCGVAIHS